MAAGGGAKLADIQWSVTPGNADLTAATALHASFAGGLSAVESASATAVAASTEYGDVQVQLSADTLVKSGDEFTIRPGDVVTLTASAPEGFEVDEGSVAVTAQALEPSSAGAARSMSVQSVAAGEAVALTKTGAATWKFFMPASPVSVAASAVPASGKAAVFYADYPAKGSKVAMALDVASGKVTLPNPDNYDPGHQFSTWYLDGTTSYDGGATVDADAVSGKVLTAQWTAAYYDVIWKDENGDELETDLQVEYGQDPSYDGETPTKAADDQYTYTFDGWSKAIDGEKTVLEAVTEAVTYFAHYAKLNIYTVTFYDGDVPYDGETAQQPQRVVDGQNAARPADPAKEGYAFGGWYSDPTFGTAFDFDEAVTGNVGLYAKWVELTSLSWASAGDAELKSLFDEYYSGQRERISITGAPGFQVGAVRSVDLTNGKSVQFRIMDHNPEDAYTVTADAEGTGDGEGKPVLFIVQTTAALEKRAMNNEAHAGGWPASDMRKYLNEDADGVYQKLLPPDFKSMLRQVAVGSAKGATDATQVTSNDYLFLPGNSELYPTFGGNYHGEHYPVWAWFKAGNSPGSDGWTRSPHKSITWKETFEPYSGWNLDATYAFGIRPCGCI